MGSRQGEDSIENYPESHDDRTDLSADTQYKFRAMLKGHPLVDIRTPSPPV
jgi:hypothetical protein